MAERMSGHSGAEWVDWRAETENKKALFVVEHGEDGVDFIIEITDQEHFDQVQENELDYMVIDLNDLPDREEVDHPPLW